MKTIGTLCLLLLFAATSFSQTPVPVGVYHEAACPSVDKTRMTKMKRGVAEAIGLLPAADCHPDAPVRYLGSFSGSWSSGPSREENGIPKPIHVSGYTKKDGTQVDAYDRPRPKHD